MKLLLVSPIEFVLSAVHCVKFVETCTTQLRPAAPARVHWNCPFVDTFAETI